MHDERQESLHAHVFDELTVSLSTSHTPVLAWLDTQSWLKSVPQVDCQVEVHFAGVCQMVLDGVCAGWTWPAIGDAAIQLSYYSIEIRAPSYRAPS